MPTCRMQRAEAFAPRCSSGSAPSAALTSRPMTFGSRPRTPVQSSASRMPLPPVRTRILTVSRA